MRVGDPLMTGSDELRDLPEAYGLALRLQAEGLDVAAIGRVLDIETESVAPLLELARAKLASARGSGPVVDPVVDLADEPAVDDAV